MENGLSKMLMVNAVEARLENVVSEERMQEIVDWLFEQPGECFPVALNAEIEDAFVNEVLEMVGERRQSERKCR